MGNSVDYCLLVPIKNLQLNTECVQVLAMILTIDKLQIYVRTSLNDRTRSEKCVVGDFVDVRTFTYTNLNSTV